MHRHGYKGRKFGRERDQREALIQSLAESLVQQESIETTLPKAKAVVPYVEKLITKAKKGDLHNRRQIVSSLQTVASAHKLVDEIAPKLSGRSSGHLRIERTVLRRGDNAQLARVSFVDDLTEAPVAKTAVATKPKAEIKSAAKAVTKKPVAKRASATAKATADKLAMKEAIS
jgi:large subunit ribosomal protein L17